MKGKKETPDQTANYTVEKNIISNKLSDTNALNTYEGSFTKPRYSTGYDLDLIITNEMLNDFRQFGKRYEGTFYKNDNSPLPCGLHNKVWFDFNTLQDPVSCYVDSMVYNVKQNAYSMVMHLPNQDVDIFAPVYEKNRIKISFVSLIDPLLAFVIWGFFFFILFKIFF